MTLELAILLGFDGQLKQDSDMEMELFQSIIKQLENFGLEGKEQALVWLYVTTWNKHGEHILDYGDLWTFTDNDMEAALITMAYPKKEDLKIDELKGIIMERFNNDTFEFYKWSLNISKVAIAEIKQRKEGTKRKKEIQQTKRGCTKILTIFVRIIFYKVRIFFYKVRIFFYENVTLRKILTKGL